MTYQSINKCNTITSDTISTNGKISDCILLGILLAGVTSVVVTSIAVIFPLTTDGLIGLSILGLTGVIAGVGQCIKKTLLSPYK